jgi:multidrug efflux pump subunit AcrA (membrane-fusion protein)
MTRKTKRTLWLSFTPALIGAFALLYFLILQPRGAGASVQEVSYEIVDVEAVTGSDTIEISGNIEPVKSADLAFPIAGYLETVYVEEGELVESGDVVAELEDSQQRYDLAEVEMEIDTELISGTRRNLSLLELKKAMVETSLEDTRLTSTFTGLVSQINFEEGDYVKSSEAGSVDDVVVRVIDRSSMSAVVEVDELDASLLSLGQTVVFQFDAYPELIVTGEVSFIPLEARETSQGIAVLDTEVTILDPPDEILPYFTFAGEILLTEEDENLLLPEDAVTNVGERSMVLALMSFEDAENTRAGRPSGAAGAGAGFAIPEGLDLPEGFTVTPVPVTVEDAGSGRVSVLDGLAAGDRVLVLSSDIARGDANSDEGKDSTNVMELLGMPSGPGGGPGGGPPPAGP